MNKSELIEAVANSTGLSKVTAGKAVDAVITVITTTLKEGDQVTLVGFGSFYVRRRADRFGRDPRTGKLIEIKAAKIPAFRPGKSLKDTVQ
ncbi:MAG: HU family DNA-binding protein [Candidatus Competibacteraceae bacterium]